MIGAIRVRPAARRRIAHHAAMTSVAYTSPMPSAAATPDKNLDHAADLIYVDDSQPGFRRIRCGKGFSYRDLAGKPIRDRKVLTRIHTLAIPPAYVGVWICSDPRGHLQATGRDARGRKQYRYHARWDVLRGRAKFDHIVEFGESLPRMRRRIRRDLRLPGLPRDKVLALLVRLLDCTLLRVGNDCYTKSNHSYGLTTLRSRHLRAQRGRLRFVFRGKSGQQRDVELDDARILKIVRRVQQLPGQRLFQYVDDDGQTQAVDSGMLNRYIQSACGAGDGQAFSAKDFRTWGATVHAARVFSREPLLKSDSERAHKAKIVTAVVEVAAVLGNTPAVCRRAYIHPRIISGWLDGSLGRAIPEELSSHPRKLEKVVLRFLRQRR